MALPYDDDFENNNPFAEPEPAPQPPLVDEVTKAMEQKRQEHERALQEQREREARQQLQDAATAANDASEASNDTTATDTDLTSDEFTENLPERVLKQIIPERLAKHQLKFKLTAIEKNRPGNPILKFNAYVAGLPKFRQKLYKDVRRTYAEMVKFNKYLTGANLECFVPVIPPAHTAYTGEEGHHYLMEVWQEWFDRILANPIVIRDEEFVYFVENDFGYQVINNNKKLAVPSGLMRKTLKQLAPPYDPIGPLALFRPQIKGAYLTLQKLHKQLDRRAKAEKQVLVHVYDLANKLQLMGLAEQTHPGMKNLWDKLAALTVKELDLMLTDATNEMGALGDGLYLMLEDFFEIKEALTNRHLIMRELNTAQGQVDAKQLQVNKMKAKTTLDPLRVEESLRLLDYATKTRDSMALQVRRILGEMIIERKQVLEHTDITLKRMLRTYTLKKVNHHRQLLKHLELIRLDVRLVDAKGGLSRLNRDNLSNIKHNLPQSQLEGGDAWSLRTFRLLEDQGAVAPKKRLPRHKLDARNAAELLGVATFNPPTI